MTRDFDALTRRKYDLLVVGGGIHGLFAAYDAALRGLSVALVERGDFGSGLSFNHQRTIHGGLRAVQTGNLAKAREQIRERRTWACIAPHLLRPLPFLIGTYRWSKRSRSALRAGFAVYDVLGRSRNRAVSPELHLPKARLESAAATRRLFPGVATKGLSGGAIWYDYQTIHPDRLTWTVALAAERAGAHLVNYAEAVRPLWTGDRVSGAHICDRLTTSEAAIEATCTLLATGSALGDTMNTFHAEGAPSFIAALNVLVNRPARDIALVAPLRSGRMLTVVPWRGFVLGGTFQYEDASPASDRPSSALVDRAIADLDQAFPSLALKRGDVRLVHYGLVAADQGGSEPELLAEPRLIRHRNNGGVISLIGVKYTTARLAAERAIDAVATEVGRRVKRCDTHHQTLPHAGIADVEGRLLETSRELNVSLDRDVFEHLASWYGTEAGQVLRLASASADLIARLAPDAPVLRGEIAYAVEKAVAFHLTDAVLRRTPLGSAGHPGPNALLAAAETMQSRLGWSDEQTASEIAAVERTYAIS